MWHYRKGNQNYGPISPQQLRQYASQGIVLSTDYVFKDGWSQWRYASQVNGLRFIGDVHDANMAGVKPEEDLAFLLDTGPDDTPASSSQSTSSTSNNTSSDSDTCCGCIVLIFIVLIPIGLIVWFFLRW